MSFFFKDISKNNLVLWDDLINDLKSSDSFNPFCNEIDFYLIFKSIILSMLYGIEITLADGELTNYEFVNTGYDSNLQKVEFGALKSSTVIPDSKNELIEKLVHTNPEWKINLFTSGSTGLPKKVTHTFKSITRSIKYFEKRNQNIWGFAYHPSHIAGVQVFLQAILNGDSLVRLFGIDSKSIFSEIQNCKLTHISATPTFFKLLLPINETNNHVQRITLGGETLSIDLLEKLKTKFTNAVFSNIYASTELGAVLTSKSDLFTIRDKYSEVMKIENNELIVHADLLSDSQVKAWYHTGDMVEVIATNPITFRFVSRNNKIINIAGNKVNLNEVGLAIKSIDGIADVRVFARANSLVGNILYCEIILTNPSLTETDIRINLRKIIQAHKIPRFIEFVNEFKMTRTGKTKLN